jgi:hypothetical protein
MKKTVSHYSSTFILLLFVYANAGAQQTLPNDKTDSIAPEKSSLQIGISFSSQALSSGRNFGVSQYVLSPSICYYHKSGLHAGIEGNILSDAVPAYNLTTLSIGYADSITQKWNYGIGYTRNLFNPDTAGLIQNALTASINFLPKYFNASLQYSYLFGDEKAHRLVAGANAYLLKDSINKIIDYISFAPGVFCTFGTANVPFSNFTSTQFQKGTGSSWQQWRTQRSRRRNGASSTAQNLEFGLMNIDLSLPVMLSIKNFQVGFSYTYAIPQKLSEEESSDINPTSYFGISLGYTIH